MDIEKYRQYCMDKKGVTEHLPFDQDVLVFKIGGKIFALTSLRKWEEGNPAVSLKCDPEKALHLRANYSAVKAGYHLNKTHWNTISVNEDVPDQLLQELIDHSYDLIVAKLPKGTRENL